MFTFVSVNLLGIHFCVYTGALFPMTLFAIVGAGVVFILDAHLIGLSVHGGDSIR